MNYNSTSKARPARFARILREQAETTIDVIGVPAVGADAVTAWKGDERDLSSWLEEDLCEALPLARVLFYDHGAMGGTDDLLKLADRLLGCIRKLQGEDRPLTFVCHSTGGLVVKQALVIAGEVERYKGILTSCFGVTFLAVPHRGSDVLSNPELMNKLSIPASMREQLTKDNHQLISLIDEFAEVMPNIQIWSFYETLGSDLAGQSAESGDSLPIVSMESAAFGLGEDTPLSSDHFGVAAFRDPIKAAERTSDRPVSGRLPLPKYLQELQIVTARALWPSINVLQNVLVENHLFSRPGRDPQLPLRMQSVKRSLGRILGRDFDDFIGKPSRETGPSQPNSPGRPPSPRRPPSPKHQPRKFSIPKPAIKPKRPDVPMSYRRQSAISGQGVSFEERSHGTQKPKPKEDQALDVKEIQTQSKWEDQSEDRRDERDAPSSYLFRWIHVPCTNVAWAEKILRSIAEECKEEHLCDQLLREECWSKRQNRASHQSPHARYMHSTCEFVSWEPRGSSRDNADPTDQNRVQLALYFPYLEWESFKRLVTRAEVMRERMKRPEYARLKQKKLVRSESFNRFRRREAIYPRERVVPPGDLEVEPLRTYSPSGLLLELAESVEFQLIWEYLMQGIDLHCRRSLDQFMYTTLPDTSDRDKDQVFYKRTKRMDDTPIREIDGYDHGKDGSVLVVDQLWLWVLNEDTVVTFFPENEVKENKDPDKEGDLRTVIHNELSGELGMQCEDVWDVVALIIKHSVTVLLDRVEHTGPQVFRKFEEYTQELTDKLAKSPAGFMHLDGEAVGQILEDLEAFRELRDIDDELRTIKKILIKQEGHIDTIKKRFEEGDFRDRGRGRKGVSYLADALARLKGYQDQLTEMLETTELAKDAYTELIDMKQKQIHLNEAITMNRDAQVSAEQSRAVMVFTAPISFVVIVIALFLALKPHHGPEGRGAMKNHEVIIECLIITLDFVGRWTGSKKVLAAISAGWVRIRPQWLSHFRETVKERRDERYNRRNGTAPPIPPLGIKPPERTLSSADKTMGQWRANRSSALSGAEKPVVIPIRPVSAPAMATEKDQVREVTSGHAQGGGKKRVGFQV